MFSPTAYPNPYHHLYLSSQRYINMVHTHWYCVTKCSVSDLIKCYLLKFCIQNLLKFRTLCFCFSYLLIYLRMQCVSERDVLCYEGFFSSFLLMNINKLYFVISLTEQDKPFFLFFFSFQISHMHTTHQYLRKALNCLTRTTELKVTFLMDRRSKSLLFFFLYFMLFFCIFFACFQTSELNFTLEVFSCSGYALCLYPSLALFLHLCLP